MRLEDGLTATSQARNYARRWSAHHDVADTVAADVELVVSELVANALRHAAPPYQLGIRRTNGTIRGDVADKTTTPPRLNLHPDENGGYGLNIVTTLTSRWGSTPMDHGKHVWFEIDL